MGHFKAASLLLLFISSLNLASAQDQRATSVIYAKVIGIDSKNIFDNSFTRYLRLGEKRYYYALLHIKGLMPNGDSVSMAFIFDIKRQFEEASSGFGIKRDSIYRFDVSKFFPCCSDFPGLVGCKTDSLTGQSIFVPHRLSVVRKEYKEILRVLDFSRINNEIWEELIYK